MNMKLQNKLGGGEKKGQTGNCSPDMQQVRQKLVVAAHVQNEITCNSTTRHSRRMS